MTESLQNNDTRFMREALRQARKGSGRTSPNPAVGAVIVDNGNIIAKGYHKKAGFPHAEVDALKMVEGKAPGCTLYVTLEPCNHHGRTPPCTESIVKSGISRVVVGMKDPNPDVSGGGCEFLEKSGIEVKSGVLEKECRLLNEAFLKYVLAKRPFVISKSAVTLDGWTGTKTGHSKWITNDKSRQFVHRLRDNVDAVMVGVGTVLADDPQLTVRLSRSRGRDPLRVVVDSRLRTPPHAKIVNHTSSSDTMLAIGEDVAAASLERFNKKGVMAVVCPTTDGRIDLAALMDILVKKSVSSVLLEGGATLAGAMLREKLIDKCYIFTAPKILGGDDGIPMFAGAGPKEMDQSLPLKDIKVRRFGDDSMVVGYPDYGQIISKE
jgi:diaminohydroxyphosphoribosylaminopyrimidine deaminase/5-amino-6-(5-phosphoribosylamino)uracil reductase